MRFIEKIANRQKDKHNPPITVAFLGDSVTQGCFEIYRKNIGGVETVFDPSSAYHRYFAEIFETLCPNVPINIINAGVSGASAPFGLASIEEFVLCHKPDLTVVCYGLNDAAKGVEELKLYIDSLSLIFDRLSECGSEIIFMTPNSYCTEISTQISEPDILAIAKRCLEKQLDGTLDAYIDAARALCKEKGIPVSDVYAKWKRLSECGINVTELLSNKVNHPTREMNKLFAYSLAETVFSLD